MITIETLRTFWGVDLTPLRIPRKFEKELSRPALKFLNEYGFPASERMFQERKTYILSTTAFRHHIFNEETIKSKSPFFEFTSSLVEPLLFQGERFVRIGREQEYDIAIEVISESVYYLIRKPPDPWPSSLPPLVQKLFLNSSIDRLAMSLTAEFIACRELIQPRKDYVDAWNSKNEELKLKSQEETKRIIHELEIEFMELDREGLMAFNSWWRAYLDETRMLLGVG